MVFDTGSSKVDSPVYRVSTLTPPQPVVLVAARGLLLGPS